MKSFINVIIFLSFAPPTFAICNCVSNEIVYCDVFASPFELEMAPCVGTARELYWGPGICLAEVKKVKISFKIYL
jgi:hypothetical protein